MTHSCRHACLAILALLIILGVALSVDSITRPPVAAASHEIGAGQMRRPATPTRTRTPTPLPIRVFGTVMNARRAVVVQARVCVLGTSLCTITGSYGQYTLTGVVAGNRTIRITHGAYAAREITLALRAGQMVVHNVTLAPLATVVPTRTATRTPTPTVTPTRTGVPGVTFAAIPAGAGLDAYRIMRTEVTNAQYRACVVAGACTPPRVTTHYRNMARASHPVVYVTRQQARDYAAWLGGSLPSAAQWVRACQGDDGRLYPWGDSAPDAARANYRTAGILDTAIADSYPAGASPYDVRNMSGNVAEWIEPEASDSGQPPAHGGHFASGAQLITCGARSGQGLGNGFSSTIGFRVIIADP
jgi:hypothetical protein